MVLPRSLKNRGKFLSPANNSPDRYAFCLFPVFPYAWIFQNKNYIKAAFAIPYEILFSEQKYIDLYLKSCLSDLRCYQELCSVGFHHDSAGYALPHALRNILIICATPYEWKHMIGQRICRRNTDETRIVMLDIWQKLYEFDPVLFSPKLTGPFCQR